MEHHIYSIQFHDHFLLNFILQMQDLFLMFLDYLKNNYHKKTFRNLIYYFNYQILIKDKKLNQDFF